MKKVIAILSTLILIAATATVYLTSNLSRDKAEASYAPDPDRSGMNTLTVLAPYGYYVIEFSAVPKSPPSDKQIFQVSGIGSPRQPHWAVWRHRDQRQLLPEQGRGARHPARADR